ncbi:MAG: glycoside hydrolase family 97 protein [Candidatus Marinimicrobia bacterium]|nr:glycoside hydrolase family 97 protein [Candidatus Neomarinimicrobiota bacterium]
MKKVLVFVFISFSFLLINCSNKDILTIQSPDGNVQIQFLLQDKNQPFYRVYYNGEQIVDWSKLGFQFRYKPALKKDLEIAEYQTNSRDTIWKPVWGQKNKVRNNYNQLLVKLKESSRLERRFDLIFRVYNDGIGFRYVLPDQQNLQRFEITSEETEFNLNKDNICWWIPANYDSYELLYNETDLKQVDSVNTPITMQTKEGHFLSLHEAALTDYAGMTLVNKNNAGLLTCDLVPWPDGVKVKAETPFKTPWRTIQLASKPGDLIESSLIVNLNEPCKISDTDWIKPMKYTGIWWGMHIDKYTWHAGDKHGATTENAKQLIDFSAKHNTPGMLVEGWNVGWKSWLSGNNVQNYTKPYDDFDIKEVVEYGRKNGVNLIGHHESGANIPMYERQMQAAFQYYADLGVNAVKTGYAGGMRPQGMYHHGQWMVNHYRKVVKLAARHKIMIDAHEPIKPTGIRRTWPNMMTREGVRGMEYNAWAASNPPEHTTILPFTRVLGGPVDYTPGIFDLTFDQYKPDNRVLTTLAKQLAYYVVLYSPMQMVADLPENYDHPAFQFIENVAVDWDTTMVIDAEIGDYVVIARKAGDEWFLGGITDEHPRRINIPLNFLTDGSWLAEIYCDAPETGLYENPTAIEIAKYTTESSKKLQAALSTSGGIAIRFIPGEKVKDLSKYESIQVYNNKSDMKMENFKALKIYSNSKSQ